MKKLSKRGEAVVDILWRQMKEEYGAKPYVFPAEGGMFLAIDCPEEGCEGATRCFKILKSFLSPSGKRRKYRRKNK